MSAPLARTRLAALALGVSLAMSCGEEREAPEVEQSTEPRGPRGQAPARCDGASDDPAELDATWAHADADLDAAIASMEAIAGGHSGSATARVRLGELELRRGPSGAATAERWLQRGLALHEEGCTLGHRDQWAMLEGLALARMMQGDYAAAIPFLRQSLERWPSMRATRYNLACALCKTGDLDGCARELGAVMQSSDPPPAFLREQDRPSEHYRELARRDPDLAALRADAARFEHVLGSTR